MRFSSWKRFVALALLVILAQAVMACGGDEESETSPFRIGVMESLTGAGDTYGNVAVQAKTMAMDEINDAGGINGRMLELVIEDSKCSAQDAINAYNKLTDVDGMKIILGDVVQRRDARRRSSRRGGRSGALLGPRQQPRHRQRRRLHFSHADQ